MTAAGNISFLKGDYTEENRYFGKQWSIECFQSYLILGTSLPNCHFGSLYTSSPCANIFFSTILIIESFITAVQGKQHEGFLTDNFFAFLFVDR